MIRKTCLILIIVYHFQREAESLLGKKVVKAEKENFRFVVSVGIKHGHPEPRLCQTCTGIVVTLKHVLTTTHCIENQDPNNVEILAGSVDIRNIFSKDHYDVQTWTTYEQWAEKRGIKPSFEENDVVIIEVKRKFDETKVVPAKFRFVQNEKLYSHRMTLAGWGETGCSVTKYYKPNTLKRAEVKMMPSEKVRKRIRSLSRDPESYGSNFIFSRSKPFVLAGRGDSGGPVIHHNHVVAMVRGIIPGYEKYYECQLNGFINLIYYQDFISSFTENGKNSARAQEIHSQREEALHPSPCVIV